MLINCNFKSGGEEFKQSPVLRREREATIKEEVDVVLDVALVVVATLSEGGQG